MDFEGNTKTVSLLELFRDAHQYRSLSGEMITQDVAVLRLLLAILHASIGGRMIPKGPVSAMRYWKTLWDNASFPYTEIEKYLLQWQAWFDLFHPTNPFYQVNLTLPVVHKDGKEIVPAEYVEKMFIGEVAESGNAGRLFASRKDFQISYAEAARWLIYTNSFDIAPCGAPPKLVKKIQGYGIAWCNLLGLIWADGNNLFETLMLNFVMSANNTVYTNATPTWEKDTAITVNDLIDIDPIFPSDPAALLSMQFRNSQLIRSEDNKSVIGYNIWSGNKLDPENAFLEHMTVWQMKKDGNYVPKVHNPSIEMWRDFSSILCGNPQTDNAAGIVKWIAALIQSENLNIPLLRLNIAGSAYTNNTSINDVFSDSLSVNTGILESLGDNGWIKRIEDEVRVTEKYVDAVRELSQSLALSKGETAKNIKKKDKSFKKSRTYNPWELAKTEAYFKLDIPFRDWLANLKPESGSLETQMNDWRERAQKIVRAFGLELISKAGVPAFIGHDVGGMNAPKAYNTFLAKTKIKG